MAIRTWVGALRTAAISLLVAAILTAASQASPATTTRPTGPGRPKAGPAQPAKPRIDAEGWWELPVKGARGVEVTVEGRSRIRIRALKDATGRMRARALVPGGAQGASPASTQPRLEAPPRTEAPTQKGAPPATQPPGKVQEAAAAAGAPGAPPAVSPGYLMEVTRESGIVYISPSYAEPTTEAGVDLEVEIPSRLALTVLATDTDLTLSGDPVPISPELEPYEPPARPGARQPASTPGGGSVPPPPGPASPAAPRIAGGSGGAVELKLERGSLKIQDVLSNVTIEKKEGPVTLEKLAGTIKVHIVGAGSVSAAGLNGPLFVQGGSLVLARGLRSMTDIKDVAGKVELRGVGGDIRLNLRDAEVEIEDARGRVEARQSGGSARMGNVLGFATLTMDSADLSGERLMLGMQVGGSHCNARLREINGPISVSGSPDRIEVDSSSGPVNVRGDASDIRLRDIQTDVIVQIRTGDVTVDRAGGRVVVNTQSGRAVLSGMARPVQVNADTIDADMASGMDLSSEYTFQAQRFLRLSLPGGPYDIKVQAQGEIRSDFPFQKLGNPADPAAGKSGAPPPGGAPPGGGAPARNVPPPPAPSRAGPKISITCAGDVDIRQG